MNIEGETLGEFSPLRCYIRLMFLYSSSSSIRSTMDHPATALYSELVGKRFQGVFQGCHPISFIDWLVYRITPDTMDANSMYATFRRIFDMFEGRIWKGIVLKDGSYNIYVKPDEIASRDKLEWEVKGYERFQPENWVMVQEYMDKVGFCLKLS